MTSDSSSCRPSGWYHHQSWRIKIDDPAVQDGDLS
jgi:hypothetical protein